jgi:phage baseplate assembly protein W
MYLEYIGRRIAFPLMLDDRNRFAMVGGDAAIRQSIYLIIHTVPGERVMRPDFGCEIHSLIFDPANEETATTAERYVTDALNRWEPRIELKNVTATVGDTELGELMITINYRLKDQLDERSLVYPYYLNPDTEQS